MTWLLIFYLTGTETPAALRFYDQMACENAGKYIMENYSDRYQWHRCMPIPEAAE